MTENDVTDAPGAEQGGGRVDATPLARVPGRTGRPLYEQLANDLRLKISEGVYAVGAALPSTARLMREYGVSVTAARAAVGVLKHEGIVIGQPGKAVYVQRQVRRADRVDADVEARLGQLTELVHDLARRVADLEQGRVPRGLR